jgi:hypothetical protein
LDGIEEYPFGFDRLVELQKVLGQPRYLVVTQVLDHFDRIRFLDNIEENACEWLQDMVTDASYYFSEAHSLPDRSCDQLYRLYNQTQNEEILQIVMDKIDKHSPRFHQICSLKYMIQNATTDLVEELADALDQADQPQKCQVLKEKIRESGLTETEVFEAVRVKSARGAKGLFKLYGQGEALQRLKKVGKSVAPEKLIECCLLNPGVFDVLEGKGRNP